MRTTLISLGAAAAAWTFAAAPAEARSDYPDLAFAAPTTAPLPLLAGADHTGTDERNGPAATQARRAAPADRRRAAPPQQAQRPHANEGPRPLPCPPDDVSRVCLRGGTGSDAIPDSVLMRQRQIL